MNQRRRQEDQMTRRRFGIALTAVAALAAAG